MGDRLWTGNHTGMQPPSQANSPCYPTWDGKIVPVKSAVMLCGWGVKAGWLIPFHMWITVRVWQVKLCDPLLTRANLSALGMGIAHIIKHCTNVLFTTTILFWLIWISKRCSAKSYTAEGAGGQYHCVFSPSSWLSRRDVLTCRLKTYSLLTC